MNSKVTKIAMATAIGASLTVAATAGLAADKGQKCYGVVKAHKNGCAANKHACAGQATVNGDPAEWIILPKGVCDSLVNGSTKPPKAKKAKAK